jgi:ABC-type phosphate/phosphonate transport system substrate-binding protein
MLVSLPMYDLPELTAATDAWWQGLRRHFERAGLRDLPEQLTRPADPETHWLQDRPLFSQTCGYPLTHALQGRATLLGTPRYSAPGCAGATYVSWLVVRADDPAQQLADLRGRRVAFNSRDSQSGCNTLRAMAAPLAERGRFFGDAIASGAHRRSLALVRDGAADAAAVDCVSFALIARAASAEVAGLRVLAATPAAPNLPYITAMPVHAAALQAGLAAAFADPALAPVRHALLLEGCDFLPLSCYDVIPAMEAAAVAAGYPDLA